MYTLIKTDDRISKSNDFTTNIDKSVEKTSWDIVDLEIPINTKLMVYDFTNGYEFHAIRTGGEYHADIETILPDDTQLAYSMFGSNWSWDRRPVLVMVGDKTYAASIACMPHSDDTIDGNDMDGFLCLHFLNSRKHLTGEIDTDHQVAVEDAYNWAHNN